MKTARIILYDEPTVPEIDLPVAIRQISHTFGICPELKGPIFHSCTDKAMQGIAACRIRNMDEPFRPHSPTAEEIKLEGKHAGAIPHNICYDGFELQNALGSMIPARELTDDILHIIFTDRLTCTYDGMDRRYHARSVICSNPSIISTSGIIEAPAKPREYYTKLISYSRMGISTDTLKEEFKGKFLEYNDPRLARIIPGYVMQAIFYHETHEPFCRNPDCMLYNAHWQSELLHSQIVVGRLCGYHSRILDGMRHVNQTGSAVRFDSNTDRSHA